VVCTCDGVKLTAMLMEGRFPPWRDPLLPSKEDHTVVLAADLLSATTAAAIVTSKHSKGVVYEFAADCIHMTAQSPEAGKSSVKCKVQESGYRCKVKVDSKFISDWLLSLPPQGNPIVTITATDKGSAVILRSDGTYTGVIMPLDTEA
jgi:DNA polymerase III sliding clamp (beta) subunit (PCNA family)